MPISLVGMDGTTPLKIEHPRTNVVPATRVGTEAGQSPAKAASAAGTDAVRLSRDVQLAERALRAASTQTDDARADAVARLRELHERGELSVDVDRLADCMIDALIHSDDEHS